MSNVVVDPFLLEAGGADPSITFTWDPENDEALPGGTTFTRASIKQEFDGTDFTELSSGTIPENSAAVGGGAQGFLPEPGATNQLDDVDLDIWSKDDVTVTDNGAGSLGLNEYELDAGTNTGGHGVLKFADATSSPRCIYAIVKEGTGRYVIVQNGSTGANDYVCYDLDTVTVTEEGALITESGIIDLGGGWYLCWQTGNINVATTNVNISDSGTPGSFKPSFTGSNETILVCQVQYTETNFPISAIVTSGTALASASDVLDTGVVIASAFSALLDLTLPVVVGIGETISLLGPDATATDILFVNPANNLIMDDGGTQEVVGAVTPGSRIKISYGRDATGRSASLEGATVVTGDAPSAAHEGDTFQLGATNSVNQSRCIHHTSTLFDVRKSDIQLETLSGP